MKACFYFNLFQSIVRVSGLSFYGVAWKSGDTGKHFFLLVWRRRNAWARKKVVGSTFYLTIISLYLWFLIVSTLTNLICNARKKWCCECLYIFIYLFIYLFIYYIIYICIYWDIKHMVFSTPMILEFHMFIHYVSWDGFTQKKWDTLRLKRTNWCKVCHPNEGLEGLTLQVGNWSIKMGMWSTDGCLIVKSSCRAREPV